MNSMLSATWDSELIVPGNRKQGSALPWNVHFFQEICVLELSLMFADVMLQWPFYIQRLIEKLLMCVCHTEESSLVVFFPHHSQPTCHFINE